MEEIVDITKSRFSDADWANELKQITIGGLGTIGSWTSLFLARIGHTLFMFDTDRVDEVNLAGQLYKKSYISDYKTEAMKGIINEFCGRNYIHNYYNEEVTKESLMTEIAISCFDNMESRKDMLENWLENPRKLIFIDGRMSMERGEVYFITPDRVEEYRETLFKSLEIPDDPCSAKSTTHCGAIIASIITGGLCNFLANKKYEEDIKEVPFKVEFNIPMMNFYVS